MMKIQASVVAALIGLAIYATPALALEPGPVHQCGTFVSYTPPSATRSGTLVIGSTTYAAAWMGSTGPAGSSPHTFNQVVANGVTAGSQVCLDGTIANSQTEGNLLTDFTVSPAPTASQSPSAPPTVVPSALATSTAQPETGATGTDFPWPLLIVVVVLAVIGLLITRSRRISAPRSDVTTQKPDGGKT
jgi:hypothetical protein